MFGIGKKKKVVDGVKEFSKEEHDEKMSELTGTEKSSATFVPSSEARKKAPALEPEKEEEVIEEEPTIGWKEFRALKKSKYEKIAHKFDKIFVLLNKKTGVMVEIRAASSFHACNIIGWRPNHVVVQEVKSYKELQKEEQTSVASSTVEKEENPVIPIPNAENSPALK